MSNGQWRVLQDWEIILPSSSNRRIALLDVEGEVLVVGRLFAAGPDSHWLIEPIAGYPQYIQGRPAEGGTVAKRFRDNFMQFGPRKERLEAARAILEMLSPPLGLGYFELVKRCKTCCGYRIDRIFQDHDYVREEGEGVYYLTSEIAVGLISFLQPDFGICRCH